RKRKLPAPKGLKDPGGSVCVKMGPTVSASEKLTGSAKGAMPLLVLPRVKAPWATKGVGLGELGHRGKCAVKAAKGRNTSGASKARMSQPAPWGRGTPRWSVVRDVPQPLIPGGMASIAGLLPGHAAAGVPWPVHRAWVSVGPPLFCRGRRKGSVLLSEVGALKAQEVSLARL